jgi:hypothetical protein
MTQSLGGRGLRGGGKWIVSVSILGEMKRIDSALDSGKIQRRVDFLERSYKIGFGSGA